jgi:hypothetical protein
MLKVTKTIYIPRDSMSLIIQNILAKDTYTIYSTSHVGTVPLDITFSIPEEFRLTEDTLQTILEGLFPALDEQAIEQKAELVKEHLRSIGARL